MSAPGLSARPYFNRYTDDAIDLCNVLSSFAPQAKSTLHELCKVMGMSGKPAGIDGSEVARYYLEGGLRKSRTIARRISSTPIRFGYAMSCFVERSLLFSFN
jgi:hypothetical protein